MSDLDDRIRATLGGLREAAVPPVPKLGTPRAKPKTAPPVLLAAAAMLVLLAGALTFMPARPPASEAALGGRIRALEDRITKIEHEELRSLLSRELALLRRELELSQVK